MELAPIVLFVYNRPWHTQQTVEALQKNDLADQSELFIFADGPKIPSDSKVQAVKDYIKTINGFKKVIIVEREKNWGLADNIVDGVTTIVNKYGRVIVLEDDIVTSPGFLKYMNEALNIYEQEDRVMHISGYWFPVKGWKQLPETFFYNVTSCWGWATWKEAWAKLELDAKYLKSQIVQDPLKVKEFTIEDSGDFMHQLDMNISGSKKTWAVKWYASMFLNNGFALHPRQSLVNNIGHDGSGDNCGESDKCYWEKLAKEIILEKIPIQESKLGRKKIVSYNHNKIKMSPVKRLWFLVPKKLRSIIKSIFLKLNLINSN
ncbi:glycosyltransferase [Phaeodactylibacter luteus]|uniref:Glycosyltransferase n=1 Tax=Phaeodactylibacter luteus TaxID=1564516 RepID=A0A5C6RNA5_9BACT|nr:glycosyltransferase [Phaeodactylibacter luteus]TXB63796.1 glycosyltransferase [Phaeodactylibacter luteus]